MSTVALLRIAALAALLAVAPAAQSATAPAPVAARAGANASEIVERNAAARGGVDAWRHLQTMAWAGHVESATAPDRHLPFLLEQKRPDRTRFELAAESGKSLRIFDGTQGWKVHPTASGRPALLPYTEDEVRFARGAQVIDGPLMDYIARGATVTVAGMGDVEGRRAYVLDLQVPAGGNHRLWVDAETYLEVRHDRQVGSRLGKPMRTTIFFRDYRTFEGIQIATTIETVEANGSARNRLVIEKIALNPALDDQTFAKPQMTLARRNAVVIDTRAAAGPVR